VDSAPCECCLIIIYVHCTGSKVHVQFCIEATDKTGSKDYCTLAVALVQIVNEKYVTAPHAVYTKLQSERGLFHTWPHEC
jgi:hypothetical protein